MMCFQVCGIHAHIREGKLVQVEGMKEHPCSKGAICPRGANMPEYVYSPDRILHPMVKTPHGTWSRVSWDDALDRVAEKLMEIKTRHGARAVAFAVGSLGAEDIEISAFFQRLRGVFGSPNFFSIEGHCFKSRILSRQLTFGTYPLEDPDNAECVVLWGHNPDATEPALSFRLKNSVKNGTRLIVIDPRKIPLAKHGIYVPVRPGTDAALALAMTHVIITEGLCDMDFVNKYCTGFEELSQHVKGYTPEKVAPLCGVSVSDIYMISRVYAGAKSASIIQAIAAIDQYNNGLQTNRALAILQAITGNYDKPGAWCTNPLMRLTDLRVPVEEKPLGADEWPLFHSLWGRPVPYGQQMVLHDAILNEKPYPVKALLTAGANPAAAWPDSLKTKEAFEKLDFMVVNDLFMTETAQLADVFLPACTYAEKLCIAYNYGLVFGMPYVMLNKRLIEPLGESWPNWKIFSELGRRMGYGDYFLWNSDEEVVSMMLEPSKITLEQLLDQPEGLWFGKRCYDIDAPKQIRTPSGKIELYSNTLGEAGYEPLPSYKAPVHSPQARPEIGEKYPLTLLPGTRVPYFTGWQHRNIQSLRRLAPEAAAEIHPSTAEAYGIVDGSYILIETVKNKITVKASVTPDILPGVLGLIHGWEREQNGNILTEYSPNDPVTGYPELRAIACRVRKVM
jgi:anaerobic selenocysteine-containing dehydrogenase